MDPLLALGALFLLTRASGGGAGSAGAQRLKVNGTDYATQTELTFDDLGSLHIFRARLTPKGVRDDVFDLAVRDFKVSQVVTR